MRWSFVSALAATAAVSTSALAAPPGSWNAEKEQPKEALADSLKTVETKRFLHGFRLGYMYLMKYDGPVDSTDPNSPILSEEYDIRTPHQFLIGYELSWRMLGHDWLNVLLVGNLMIAGLEQSRFFPSTNALLGFEISEVMQLGVGVNFTPVEHKPAHMLIAMGWTPRVGDLYTPVHAFFMPDVDGQHRTGVTIGVNW